MPLHQKAWISALREFGAKFDLELDPVLVAAAQRAQFDALAVGVQPLDEVVAYARERAKAGCPVSVASGGDAATVRRTLQTIGVSDLFSIVVTAEEVAHGKPAPDLFLLAAQRMGVAPADCLVFEDSLLGITAAERAGMGAVLVARPSPSP